jgi:predicted aminopeptidase
MAAVGICAAALAAAGCSTLGYYAQAACGHMSMLAAARPIDEWLADPVAPASLKQRLVRARQMRDFATRELGLPDNRSYTAYADLKRPAVVWNVFAAPELSLQLRTWCYPFFGCAAYRGYFDKEAAERLASELRADGHDVQVAPVPAYSTLGWFDDPLLNTFIGYGDAQLARLIFHELAHQLVYVKDDTQFNESFATAVEREGVRRWLAAEGDERERAEWAAYESRRADFLALLLEHKRKLTDAYAADGTPEQKRARKRAVFDELQQAYARLRTARWNGFAGYDRYFAQDLGNAHLAAVGAYNDMVPAFEALLAAQRGDLPRFYDATKRLAALPRQQRSEELGALMSRARVPRAARD